MSLRGSQIAVNIGSGKKETGAAVKLAPVREIEIIRSEVA